MADKKLNNVSTLTSSTLTSSDYAYVEDVSASNEQKKVLISDLAKVVGEQIVQTLRTGITVPLSFGVYVIGKAYFGYKIVSIHQTGYRVIGDDSLGNGIYIDTDEATGSKSLRYTGTGNIYYGRLFGES